MRLSLATLDRLRPAVRRQKFDPRALGIGIAHLGCGHFLRGHQAYITQHAIEAGGPDAMRWGLAAASLITPRVRNALAPQDGLFSVLIRDGDYTTPEIVGTLREIVFAPENPYALIGRLAEAPIVTLTVTEKGYCIDPASTRLNAAHPDIQHDLQENVPKSAIGWLVAGLRERRRRGNALPTVISCDNLPTNSRILRQAAIDFCHLRSEQSLADWIDRIEFPCTMVDRMVPQTTPQDLADAEALLGAEDQAAVVCEPFLQWVIERFDGPRPAWEAGGAEFVTDVAPWEGAKLRLLNASHSAMAYLGGLAGLTTITETAADPDFGPLIRRFILHENGPTIAKGGPHPAAYAETMFGRRWRNRGIRHLLKPIAGEGSRRLPQRFIAPLRENTLAGRPATCTALALAAWMQYATGRGLDGEPIEVNDPLAEVTTGFAGASPVRLVDLYLAREDIFGRDHPGRAALKTAMADLRRLGVRAAARAATQAP